MNLIARSTKNNPQVGHCWSDSWKRERASRFLWQQLPLLVNDGVLSVGKPSVGFFYDSSCHFWSMMACSLSANHCECHERAECSWTKWTCHGIHECSMTHTKNRKHSRDFTASMATAVFLHECECMNRKISGLRLGLMSIRACMWGCPGFILVLFKSKRKNASKQGLWPRMQLHLMAYEQTDNPL